MILRQDKIKRINPVRFLKWEQWPKSNLYNNPHHMRDRCICPYRKYCIDKKSIATKENVEANNASYGV